MSKYLKLSDESWRDLAEEIVEEMKQQSTFKGKFSYQITMPESDREAKIIFTAEAFAKMLSLIMVFDKEVGWYCTAERKGELDDDEYIIDDVLVFPQETTATTVDSDDEKRTEWFDSLPVETLLKVKCDCHSHVNMSTGPSGTDDKDMEAVFGNIADDGFRIFMIWNKKLEHYAVIYDMAKNLMFTSADISIEVEGFDLNDFVMTSKSMVSSKSYASYTYPRGKGIATTAANNTKAAKTTKTSAKSSKKKGKTKEEIDEDEEVLAAEEDWLRDLPPDEDDFDDFYGDDYGMGNWYQRDVERFRNGYYGGRYY